MLSYVRGSNCDLVRQRRAERCARLLKLGFRLAEVHHV